MASPRMVIAAGPSGGGKSSVFSVFKTEAVDAFNVDDRAAFLYARIQGSATPIYQGVTREVRDLARADMREFIREHLESQRSFAFETTLRDVTFEQVREAAARGFRVEFTFVAAGSVDEHIARVEARGQRGGHTASRESLHEIYYRAMRHLIDAFDEYFRGTIHRLNVFHNPTASVPAPEAIVTLRGGMPTYLAHKAPAWFHDATRGTPYELEKLRQRMR